MISLYIRNNQKYLQIFGIRGKEHIEIYLNFYFFFTKNKKKLKEILTKKKNKYQSKLL